MGNAWTPDSAPLVPAPKPVVPPPPVNPAAPGLYTVEKIQATINLIAGFADTATHLIPGDTDDKIVGVLKVVSAQPWFATFITMLLNMTQSQREHALQSMAPGFAAHIENGVA